MSTPLLTGSTGVLERTDFDPATGSPRVAHIIKPQGNKTGAHLVTEARVMGFEVEALCGRRFVPTLDPKVLPKCQACIELWEARFGRDTQPEDCA